MVRGLCLILCACVALPATALAARVELIGDPTACPTPGAAGTARRPRSPIFGSARVTTRCGSSSSSAELNRFYRRGGQDKAIPIAETFDFRRPPSRS
jgi:hypothetical protein